MKKREYDTGKAHRWGRRSGDCVGPSLMILQEDPGRRKALRRKNDKFGGEEARHKGWPPSSILGVFT